MWNRLWKRRPAPRPNPIADQRFASLLQASRAKLDPIVYQGLALQWILIVFSLLFYIDGNNSSQGMATGAGLACLFLNTIAAWVALNGSGSSRSRLIVGLTQGVTSPLLSLATGGAVVAALHLFVWLTVIAVYRDFLTLALTGAIAVAGYFILHLTGTLPTKDMSAWAVWVEHAVLVAGVVAGLSHVIRLSLQGLFDLTRREAALEALTRNLEMKVEKKVTSVTRQLRVERDRLRQELDTTEDRFRKIQTNESSLLMQLVELRREIATHSKPILAGLNRDSISNHSQSDPIGDSSMQIATEWLKARAFTSIALKDKFTKRAASPDPFELIEETPHEHKWTRQALLFVDDPVQRRLAMSTLDEAGYGVTVCHTGANCYMTSLVIDFDLLVVDMDLPNEEGFETIEAIRLLQADRPTPLRIFGLTTNMSSDLAMRCADLQIDARLEKPLDPEALHRSLSYIRPKVLSMDKLASLVAQESNPTSVS